MLSASNATDATYIMDSAITAVNTERASYGAAINRLEYAADNLSYRASIKHNMKWIGDQWYIKSGNGLYKPRTIYKIKIR